MEQLDIFGSETCEYLFVIEPDKKTSDQLLQFRHRLNQLFSLAEEALHSIPHISLCYFEASNFSDEYILTKARKAISSVPPFPIHTDNCERWKNGTFILKIKQDEHTIKLQEQLSTVFKGVIKNLHLTISRNIPEYLQVQLPIENFQYTSEFSCNSVLLLKKKGASSYQLLERIPLSDQ